MEQIDPVSALYRRAAAAGVPMSQICREAGVAETTPSRWRNKRNGPNFLTVKKLSQALDELINSRRPSYHDGEAA